MILDEPTSGLDPTHENKVQEILCSYRDARGTVFLCLHHMTLIERLCEIVLFMKSGRSIGVISTEQLLERSSVNVWVVTAFNKESKQLVMNRLKQRDFVWIARVNSISKSQYRMDEKKFFELMKVMDDLKAIGSGSLFEGI